MKIAFVIQRYGEDINGGAEYLCRLVAEHLSRYHDIEIITTCAREYTTWKNEYEPGIHYINGILVRRFKNDFERDEEFHRLYLKILGGITPDKFKDNYDYMVSNIERSHMSEQLECIRLQGPYSSDLLNYLEKNNHNYDIFIFFTYMYPTTVYGMRKVSSNKILLVPTAHDEPLIYFEIFKEIFNKPRTIIYNTEEEKKFVNSKFKNENISSDVIGVGIDVPEKIDVDNFKQKYTIDNFIIYVGRIDESKGCKELFKYFLQYKKDVQSDIKLILLGRQVMNIPKHPDIIPLGFLSEQDKFNGIKTAKLLIMPSKYESLSIVIMETWLCNNPVLANGRCDVLKGHCIKSNGGLYYENYEEFKECLNLLLDNQKLRDKMGQNGSKYVNNNYSWDIIEEKYIRLLGRLI